MNEEQKPPKLDLSLPEQTHDDRVNMAKIGPAEIEKAKDYVRRMKQPGAKPEGKKIRMVSAEHLNKLWEAVRR